MRCDRIIIQKFLGRNFQEENGQLINFAPSPSLRNDWLRSKHLHVAPFLLLTYDDLSLTIFFPPIANGFLAPNSPTQNANTSSNHRRPHSVSRSVRSSASRFTLVEDDPNLISTQAPKLADTFKVVTKIQPKYTWLDHLAGVFCINIHKHKKMEEKEEYVQPDIVLGSSVREGFISFASMNTDIDYSRVMTSQILSYDRSMFNRLARTQAEAMRYQCQQNAQLTPATCRATLSPDISFSTFLSSPKPIFVN